MGFDIHQVFFLAPAGLVRERQTCRSGISEVNASAAGFPRRVPAEYQDDPVVLQPGRGIFSTS